MAHITIEYPNLLPDSLQQTKQEFEHLAKMALAVKLFEMKKLSSGMAARLCGMQRVEFLLSLHKLNSSMIDTQQHEIASDLHNA